MGKDKFKEGEPVWARHQEQAWVRGHVSSRSGNDLKIRMDGGGSITVSIDDVEYCSTSPSQEAKVEDMTKLPDLHHPALLASLNERFKKDKIYSFCGKILIAVNPFKPLDNLYDKKRMLKYLRAGIEERGDLAPHAWTIAHNAYEAMIDNSGRNQSILVSGESGAGKTVSTKIVMNYLTVVSSGNYEEALRAGSRGSKRSSKRLAKEGGVSQRVLEANPLMEAFGNAKTLRNDNSSRFGKLIQLQFHEKNFHLVGAAIDIYLLEKSRVVHQVPGERNYHIFYEMDKGLSDNDKKSLLFPSLKDCRYTNVSGTYKRADIADKDQFKLTRQAFDILGFTPEEQASVFRMVVAILHLGNIEFDEDRSDGADGSKVTRSSRDSLEACADLLAIKADRLAEALTTRAINVGIGGALSALANKALGAENFVKKHTPEQAAQARDGMAQTLYERLFAWIVWRINESITIKSKVRPKSGKMPSTNKKKGKGKVEREFFNDFSIGCLDIFGFEVFEKNSFEQLLINYTNETLQAQFNEFVFELEQAEYEAEGVDWTVIEFPDNSLCLEMIEARPIGLLSLVDEECLYPNGSDHSLASKLYQNLGNKYRSHFLAGRNEKVRFQFTVCHFAGEVTYDVDSFCRKNKNELRQEAVDLMRSSKVDLFSIILPPDAASAGGGADPMEYFSQISSKPKPFRSSLERHRRVTPTTSRLQSKTVSSHFKTQLNIAMNHIRASEPHYIRCLKSNDENVAGIFDRIRIEEQLCYSGVLEVVKVARAGYSTRFLLADFASRFSALAHKNAKGAARKTQKLIKKGDKDSIRATCEKILANSDLVHLDDYQIGHSKVFLKPHAYSSLEIQKAETLRKYILLLQRNIRIWLLTYRATRKLRAAKKIQRYVRGYLVRREYHEFRSERKAAIQIQRIARGMITRKNLIPILQQREDAARKIKKAYKRKVMKDRLKEIREESMRQRAAIMLQGIARVIKAQKMANNLYAEKVSEQAALTLQSAARMIAAKKTKEMLEQEREAEEAAIESANGGERGAVMLYVVPMAVMFLLTNPAAVIGLVVVVIAMMTGAGLMLEAQERQRMLEDDSRSYARRARRRKGTMSSEEDSEDYYYASTNPRKGKSKGSKSEKRKSSSRKKLPGRHTDLEFFNSHKSSSNKLTKMLSRTSKSSSSSSKEKSRKKSSFFGGSRNQSMRMDAFDDIDKFGIGAAEKNPRKGRLFGRSKSRRGTAKNGYASSEGSVSLHSSRSSKIAS